MKKYKISALIIVAIVLSACNESNHLAAGKHSAMRSSAFKELLLGMTDLQQVVQGTEPYKPEDFKKQAADFAKNAREPFQYFQNDPNGNGRALAKIWQQPQAFATEREQFLQAVDKFNEAAQNQHMDEIKAAMTQIENHCQSCHQSFRAPE